MKKTLSKSNWNKFFNIAFFYTFVEERKKN